MKSILISIKPKYCELIANGKKTVEVRKTKPKIDVPFKCYIYCTSNKDGTKDLLEIHDSLGKIHKANSKVIGEFVCEKMSKFDSIDYITPEMVSIGMVSCLTEKEFVDYVGNNFAYAWHITDLVIYDKPKELSEFYVEGDCDCLNCKKCYWFDKGNGFNVEDDCNLAYKGMAEHKSFKPITRPFQSWGYVYAKEN